MKKITLLTLIVFCFVLKQFGQEQWRTTPIVVPEEEPEIGTFEKKPFAIVTNNARRLTIDSSGRVNIKKLIGKGRRLVFADSSGNLLTEGDTEFEVDGVSQYPCGSPSIEVDWNPWKCASKPCISSMIPWYEGGNQIGPQGNNTAGTCNTYDFILKANGTNHVWIKTNGKIGISEPNPTAKFEVLDPNALASGAGNFNLVTSIRSIANSNNFMHNEWVLRDNTGLDNWWDVILHDGISIDGSYLTPGVDTRTWWQRQPYSDMQSWGTGSDTYMRLMPGQLQISDQPNAPNTSALCVNVNTGNAFEIYDQSSQKINFKVLSDGSTFIGPKKVNPSGAASAHTNALLQVFGKLACTELVIIDPIKWADYVFEKNYKPMPLSDLEQFYRNNKHLPEIPSEKDVAENGISVGEMNALLLKKVEELTLYVVDLNKKIEALEACKK